MALNGLIGAGVPQDWATRVWGLGGGTEGGDDEAERIGVAPDVVSSVSRRLAERGWTALGELQDVGPRQVEEVHSHSL